MAKKLEEHLYRSAHTKQEYLDLASLKRRLHLIAEGVGVPRQPSRSQAAASTPVLSGQNLMGQNVIQPQNSMGLNQSAMQVQNGMDLSGMQPQNSMSQNVMQPQNAISQNSMQPQNGMGQSGMNQHAIQPQNATQNPIQPLSATGSQGQGPVSFQGPNPQQINSQMIAQLQMQQKQLQQAVQSQSAQIMSNQQQLLSDTPTIPENSPSSNDPASLSDDPKCDKKKIVLHQQQRRLLLLRHSKLCRLSECGTKFCPQMVVLWKHLKHCRGKTCPVPHCVSSRCVLSHHRNCKRRGLSLQCEICSPVTIHARRNGEPDGDSWNDDWDNFTVFDDEDGNGSLLQAGADTIPSNIDMSHPMDQQHSGNGSAANGLPPQIQVPQNQQSTSNAQAIQQDIEKKQTILGQIRHQKVELLLCCTPFAFNFMSSI
jgi:E1A/CREB-binding protein